IPDDPPVIRAARTGRSLARSASPVPKNTRGGAQNCSSLSPDGGPDQGPPSTLQAGIRPNRRTSLDEGTAAAYSCGVERRSDVVPDSDDQIDGACELRRLRGEVLGGEAGRAPAWVRSRRGGEPARRA